MEDPSKEPMGQGSVLAAGLVLLWLGIQSLWASWHAGTYVFLYIYVVHTGRFAQVLTVICMLLGWYLTISAWRRLRSGVDGA